MCALFMGMLAKPAFVCYQTGVKLSGPFWMVSKGSASKPLLVCGSIDTHGYVSNVWTIMAVYKANPTSQTNHKEG